MFGRKKDAPAIPSSRFCVSPLELPYAALYRYGEFEVAISKLSQFRGWPPESWSYESPCAYGILHGASIYADRSEEPLLPVKITFDVDGSNAGRFGVASLNRSSKDGNYILEISIDDPGGCIYSALEFSMQRAVISGHRLKHLRCIKSRPYKRLTDDLAPAEQLYADNAFLRKLEAGEAKLDLIVFNRISFEDDLTAKAPAWFWAWREWDFDQPQFHNPLTAKWRRFVLPYRRR